MTTLTFRSNVEFFEVFSGEAAVTKEWQAAGYNTMSFDKLYGDGMDFIGSKGFTIAMYAVMNEVVDALNVIGRHIDKNGRSCFTGKKDGLKKSGPPGHQCMRRSK
ncbi:unnamed protein product [Symbiodinium sp. CCMP2592]|nr:unnamed protein product [Symbiodinium sp. CCMP2592]